MNRAQQAGQSNKLRLPFPATGFRVLDPFAQTLRPLAAKVGGVTGFS
jgi:hypothetical protein